MFVHWLRYNKSQMKKSEFQKLIDEGLKPRLLKLGFKAVILKDCMHPEVLYCKRRLWFGASWDYRDLSLDISLGHLYWFKDVMPRVIVLGNYENYLNDHNKLNQLSAFAAKGELKAIVALVNDTIEEAIKVYDERYDQILAARLKPDNLKYRNEFYLHLGSEVEKNALSKYVLSWYARLFKL